MVTIDQYEGYSLLVEVDLCEGCSILLTVDQYERYSLLVEVDLCERCILLVVD
jgi:hypothetical protein